MFPFELQIETQHINVYTVFTNFTKNYKVKTDWDCYELILFNVFQNAVKYNRIEGEIVILLTLSPLKDPL